MADDLAGRVAFVTGAARGMGRATAERLAARGAAVAINDLDPERLEVVAAEIGPDVLPLAGSVADGARVRAMVSEVADHFGKIDTLVNNAGIGFHASFEEITEESWAPHPRRERHRRVSLHPCGRAADEGERFRPHHQLLVHRG